MPSFFSVGITSVRMGIGGLYLLIRLAVWPAQEMARSGDPGCHDRARGAAHPRGGRLLSSSRLEQSDIISSVSKDDVLDRGWRNGGRRHLIVCRR